MTNQSQQPARTKRHQRFLQRMERSIFMFEVFIVMFTVGAYVWGALEFEGAVLLLLAILIIQGGVTDD